MRRRRRHAEPPDEFAALAADREAMAEAAAWVSKIEGSPVKPKDLRGARRRVALRRIARARGLR